MILVPGNKVQKKKKKKNSTLLGLIFIEITRGPFEYCNHQTISLSFLWPPIFKKNRLVTPGFSYDPLFESKW